MTGDGSYRIRLDTLAAVITPLFYLVPIATGILSWRNGQVVRWHRASAFTVLALTVLTAGTGTAMILLAEPL